jgi:hypothetical protein
VVERTTDQNGIKSDKVILDKEKAEETKKNLDKSGEKTARIIIPDEKNEVTNTGVTISYGSVEVLAQGNIDIQIETEDAKVIIPNKSLVKSKDLLKEDLYFNLVPVLGDEKKETEQGAVAAVALLQKTNQKDVKTLSVPMVINTNMPSSDADIILPLTNVTLPTDEKERAEFLKTLGVYVEHHDGDKELLKGEIVEYKDGLLGIKIHITKFSVFTIVQSDMLADQTFNSIITKVIVPNQSTITNNKITATVANKISSMKVKVKVSETAVWKLYSNHACTKKIKNNKVKLKVGSNIFYIKVIAKDGSTKIYRLTIKRMKK